MVTTTDQERTRVKMDNTTVEEMLRDYEGGMGAGAVCRKYGTRPDILFNHLARRGLPTRHDVVAAERAERMEQAVALYLEGMGWTDILRTTGIVKGTLQYELSKRGIPLRTRVYTRFSAQELKETVA